MKINPFRVSFPLFFKFISVIPLPFAEGVDSLVLHLFMSETTQHFACKITLLVKFIIPSGFAQFACKCAVTLLPC